MSLLRALLHHLLLAVSLAAPALAQPSAAAKDTAPLVLRVMTYNLRVPSAPMPNTWAPRRPMMRELIESQAPDLIGTQEGVYYQLLNMATDLPAYDWIGLGREGGSRSEFCAVFFRRDRFEPVAFDHFWLSDTPGVIGSITWGTHYRRMVTWVRLRERATGRVFEFWNTHFDHQVEEARQKSAELIRTRIAAVDSAVPVLLVGDFNCAAGASRAHEILTGGTGFIDTWVAAAKRHNDGVNTYNGFEPARREGVRIDWILARGAKSVDEATIVLHDESKVLPSDHFAVTAVVRF